MKILLTGAHGFVGSRIMRDCTDVIAAPSLRGLSAEEIKRIVEESGADAIVHTAAISDIPTCAANPEASYEANVMLPVYLAKAAGSRKLVCFSSDQVYSGCAEPGPYTEAIVKPGNLYASQKLEMENRVLDLVPEAVMLRAEWMYDYGPVRDNYVKIMVDAKDSVSFCPTQYRGVTYLKEVAANIPATLRMPGGAYNFGSETNQSMFEITKAFAQYLGKKLKINESPDRHNLWMDCSKARAYGVDFSSVLDGLKKCADDYGLHK